MWLRFYPPTVAFQKNYKKTVPFSEQFSSSSNGSTRAKTPSRGASPSTYLRFKAVCMGRHYPIASWLVHLWLCLYRLLKEAFFCFSVSAFHSGSKKMDDNFKWWPIFMAFFRTSFFDKRTMLNVCLSIFHSFSIFIWRLEFHLERRLLFIWSLFFFFYYTLPLWKRSSL